jgi:hypothetical protein
MEAATANINWNDFETRQLVGTSYTHPRIQVVGASALCSITKNRFGNEGQAANGSGRTYQTPRENILIGPEDADSFVQRFSGGRSAKCDILAEHRFYWHNSWGSGDWHEWLVYLVSD